MNFLVSEIIKEERAMAFVCDSSSNTAVDSLAMDGDDCGKMGNRGERDHIACVQAHIVILLVYHGISAQEMHPDIGCLHYLAHCVSLATVPETLDVQESRRAYLSLIW